MTSPPQIAPWGYGFRLKAGTTAVGVAASWFTDTLYALVARGSNYFPRCASYTFSCV